MKTMKWAFTFVVVLAALAPSLAFANGRFPRAERLIEDPASAGNLTIAATYGLVVTHDRGKSWQQICEPAFALRPGYAGDPLFDLTPAGTMVVAVQTAFNRSPDHGCQWVTTLGGADAAEEVVDFTISRSTSTLLAAVASGKGATTVNQLRVSTDDGVTWAPLGAPIPIATVFTLDVAPSDPSRIYASGLSATNTGILAVSTDRGASWTAMDIPGTSLDDIPFIAAVHPTDASQVFVRTDSWKDRDVIDTANDALLVTGDAGKSWREVIRRDAKLLGFALSPDGSTVLVGYGDVVDSSRLVESTAFGIWTGATSDLVLSPVYDRAVTCLTWTKTGVYVCTSGEASGGLELAFAPDANLGADAAALMPLLSRTDVRGVVACCPGTSAAECASSWPTSCLTFDTCDAGAIDAGPLVCEAEGPGGGSSDGGGGRGAGDAGSAEGGADDSPPGGASASSGCQSSGAPGGGVPGMAMMVGAGGALFLARRARQRRRAR